MRRVGVATIVAVLVSMASPGAVGAPSEPDRVFTDPTNDGQPLPGVVTAPYADLIGGYITEIEDEVSFTLEVADLPDLQPEAPDLDGAVCENCYHYAAYHWEFSLNPALEAAGCGDEAQGECFSVVAYVGGQRPKAEFWSGCQPAPPIPFPSCRRTEGEPRITVDAVANTVTVHVPKDGFRDYSRGGTELLWTDGAVLVEEEHVDGIVAHALSVPCDCWADEADMDSYLVGTNRA